jgi:hypothetical protein
VISSIILYSTVYIIYSFISLAVLSLVTVLKPLRSTGYEPGSQYDYTNANYLPVNYYSRYKLILYLKIQKDYYTYW